MKTNRTTQKLSIIAISASLIFSSCFKGKSNVSEIPDAELTNNVVTTDFDSPKEVNRNIQQEGNQKNPSVSKQEPKVVYPTPIVTDKKDLPRIEGQKLNDERNQGTTSRSTDFASAPKSQPVVREEQFSGYSEGDNSSANSGVANKAGNVSKLSRAEAMKKSSTLQNYAMKQKSWPQAKGIRGARERGDLYRQENRKQSADYELPPELYSNIRPETSVPPIPNTSGESYANIYENAFLSPQEQALSTFSIDVDVASYANVRRYLNQGSLPPADAVRIEELVNYFKYDYAQPQGKHPFTLTTEITQAPWNSENKLLLVAMQGKEIAKELLPPMNLVFLIDVSGSMSDQNKLPLLIQSFSMLVEQLRSQDKVSLTVYAGAAGVVLPPTPGNQKSEILSALNRLNAGGSTAGGAGIKLAYQLAKENFNKKGNNRVILATDGDFNVGASSDEDMVTLIERERKSGVFLSVLGFGMGNYKDSKMEKLADKGNGNYAYIDNLSEAKKVLVQQMGGTLHTIAKDVKIQIEFNPENVGAYRLIGYENRVMAAEDFNNDKKDAGELGAGHTVTALYEIAPPGGSVSDKDIDDLRYQKNVKGHSKRSWSSILGLQSELATVKLRYKQPNEDKSQLLQSTVYNSKQKIEKASENIRFASAVAEFGMLLRGSQYRGQANWSALVERAQAALGEDEQGYRSEFIRLAEAASRISGTPVSMEYEER